MRPIPLVAAVALVACSPRVPSAQEVTARSGAYSVEAVDEGGRKLSTFEHRGRTYVLGALGQRYLLRFRNGSGRRVEVVASVDGRDVVDGRPASLGKRGYVVAPYGELTIDGFRTSDDAVAAFRFSSVARSYAARRGDARDVGVVGLAVFAERARRWEPPPDPYPAVPHPGPAQEVPGRPEAQRDGGGRGEGPEASPPSASSPDGGAVASAPRGRKAERPGLGTEFGEEHASRVRRVGFERASSRPAAVLTLRYDDREGLLAAGVDVDGARWAHRDELRRRDAADPFRGDRFAAPPPGWRR